MIKKEGERVKRRIVLLSNWNKHDLICACLFCNPCCDRKDCEEIEVTLNPYDDLETVMKDQRKYKRVRGKLQQR